MDEIESPSLGEAVIRGVVVGVAVTLACIAAQVAAVYALTKLSARNEKNKKLKK